MYNIDNDFFGHDITVAGLITGNDLANQLKQKQLGSTLFLPRVMLESEGRLFLDNIELDQLKSKLDIEIQTIPNDGEVFLRDILGL